MASVWTDERTRHVVKAARRHIASSPYVIIALICISRISYGQEPPLQEADELQAIAVKQEPLEEVIVIAPRSLSSMRAEIIEVENKVFDIFNAVNSDNDYDVSCRRETPSFSHIPQRVCRPRFVDRIESSATQMYLRGDGYFDPRAEIRHHQQILEERMRTLVEENPQLYEAISEFYLIKTEFEAERKKRLEGRFFVW